MFPKAHLHVLQPVLVFGLGALLIKGFESAMCFASRTYRLALTRNCDGVEFHRSGGFMSFIEGEISFLSCCSILGLTDPPSVRLICSEMP